MNCPGYFQQAIFLPERARFWVRAAMPCPPRWRLSILKLIKSDLHTSRLWLFVLACESIMTSEVKYIYSAEKQPLLLSKWSHIYIYIYRLFSCQACHNLILICSSKACNGNRVHCWGYFQHTVIWNPQILTSCTLFSSHPLQFIN